MDFMFTGFREDHGIRRYTFRGVSGDRTQGEFTVHADTVLLQKYGIPFQELPLLCRRLLERKQPNGPSEAVMFDEDLMREHADEREALKQNAQMHKKKYHKPNSGVPGEAWRGLR